MNDGFSKDLDAWLNATSDRYVVDRTLKQTATETTQVVYRKNEFGEPSFGPFVRKLFVENTEQGIAYEQLLRAQAAGLRLAHVPLVYECDHTDGQLEVVMECLQGQTLREYVESEGSGVDMAAQVVPQLCDAIAELHESFSTPLIHRDIKPSNVMVCSGQVKLIDLGIARVYRTDATRDTVRYGTPGYAPPEQFGYEQTNVRSDVYALGMTVAFCLIGEDPTAELRERAFADPRIPLPLQQVLTKATQFDPNNRYGSARELKRAFVNALGAKAQPPAPHTPTSFVFTQQAAYVAHAEAPATAPALTQTPAPAVAQAAAPAPAIATAQVAPSAAHPPTPPAAQDAFNAKQQTAPQADAKSPNNIPLRTLGLVWDFLLLLLWLLFAITIIAGSSQVEKAPPVLGYMVGVFCVIVPGTCIVFPLLDKRLFRDKIPIVAKLSKGQEVLACIAVGVISFVSCALIVIIWNMITLSGG